MDCLDSLDQIFSFIDGQIDDEELIAEIEEHIKYCRRCYDVVEFEKRIQSFVQSSLCKDDVPEEVCCRAKDMLKKFRQL
jgi:anti-sigma factor (TIGR02949 family)